MSGAFDDFAELEGPEAERLRRVHELLAAADGPPELPPTLVHPPAPPVARLLPRRRRLTLALVAAALCVGAFGAGYLVGGRDHGGAQRTLAMAGVGDARVARASLALYAVDDAGNWPMRLTVLGLPPGAYELWLTRGGELAASCGRFRVTGGETEVVLNAPYRLRGFDGWVVTPVGSERTVLTT